MSQTELWHRDDYRVFNDQILPEIMRFLKQNPKDHEDFSFSFNYRAQLKSGQYRSLLQRSTYFIDQKTGLPLIAVGSVFDISHFKDDNRIIFTIEKTERNFTAITKTPVVKKIYYTDKDYDVLTNRELEILSSMQEG